jgi:hypothetical protein
VNDLQKMSPEDLLVLATLVGGDSVFPETCVHEASHAVVAHLLDVPFDYVTVVPNVPEDGPNLQLGHIFWGQRIGNITRDAVESYALAIIAPQVALPLFGIERTPEEAEEEFSGDDLILDRLLRFKPELTRSYLLEHVREIMNPAVLRWIHTVADELKEGKTLTAADVRVLIGENQTTLACEIVESFGQ